MKKVFTIAAIFIFSFCHSQSVTVNDQPIQEIDVEYIQILGTSKLFSDKVTVEIDFGQNTKFFSNGKETQVVDASGEKMKFNSMIDALNFMNAHGFEFVQAYAFSVNNQNVYHYLMKKRSN